MQFLAMITMLTDHVGKSFFPEQLPWQLIGRIAFPIYAYCIVTGYRHTRNLKRYMKRLFAIALISQLPFMIVFNTWGINVVGTLLISLIVIAVLDKYKNSAYAFFLLIPAAGIVLEAGSFDYGVYGLLLVLIYRYSEGYRTIFWHGALNALFILIGDLYLSAFNLISTLGIVLAPKLLAFFDRIKIPRWLWRSFYPAHLIALAIAVQWLKE